MSDKKELKEVLELKKEEISVPTSHEKITTENVFGRLTAIAMQSKGWFKFLGVLMIIYGIILAISIVGILVAWLPIWMGVLLFQAGSRAEGAVVFNDARHLVGMFDKLRVFFVIQGVLAIIGLAGLVIGFIAAGGAIFSIFEILGLFE